MSFLRKLGSSLVKGSRGLPRLGSSAVNTVEMESERSISTLGSNVNRAEERLQQSQVPVLSPPSSILFSGSILNRINLSPMIVPNRGMKVVGRVKRRCKDCKMEWKDGILYNFCDSFPRHKQTLKPRYWANLRILTHVQMNPKRPW